MWQFSGMEVARITARGRTTIPKRIREEVGLLEGDVVAFEISRRLTLDRLPSAAPGGLNALTFYT